MKFPGLAIPNEKQKPLNDSSEDEGVADQNAQKKSRVTSSAIFINEKSDSVVDDAMSQLEALAPSSAKPKKKENSDDDSKIKLEKLKKDVTKDEDTKKGRHKNRSRSRSNTRKEYDRKKRRSSSRGRSRSRHRSHSRSRHRSRSRNKHRSNRSRSRDVKYRHDFEYSKKVSNGRNRSKSRDRRSRSRSRGRKRNRSRSYERKPNYDSKKYGNEDSPERSKQKSHGMLGSETMKDDPVPGKVYRYNIYIMFIKIFLYCNIDLFFRFIQEK